MRLLKYRARALVLLASASLTVACRAPIAKTGASGDTMEGKVFGMPEAKVTQEAHDGPLVEGDTLTLAPEIAKLAPGNRTHEVRVDIVGREIEVGDGIRYQAWTFGGSVPGPVLHVREGDRISFRMTNRSGERAVAVTPPTQEDAPYLRSLQALDPQKAKPAPLPMPHSIDLHAATVAMTDKWRTIQPGDSIQFEWVANYPGVYLYHCGTPPVFLHMSMGQYGVVVVSPRNGFPTDDQVDREFVIVQSEFYLKPGAGDLYELDYEAAQERRPLIVAFNGHQTSLVDRPLVVKKGERIRLYVHNVGPTGTSSFHVIGTIFDRVYYEGNPHNEMRGMQTVLLGASNGAVLEFVVPEDGGYALVDHEFADAAKGAVGRMVTEGAQVPSSGAPAMVH